MDWLMTFLSIALVLYVVYQLGSLAGIFSERAGVANVAIEGNMIVGAVVFALFYENIVVGMGPIITFTLSLVFTVFLAGTFMFLMSLLTNRYLSDHIIAGTGLNLLAPALMLLTYNMLTVNSAPGLTLSNISMDLSYFQAHLFGNDRLNYLTIFYVVLTIIICLFSAHMLNHTRFGLRLKSSGENPYALETAGVSVAKTRLVALYISGMLSSLAGAAFILRGNFYFTVEGSGFLAIGIMILGQYRVLGTTIGSVVLASFIGFINTALLLTAGQDSILQANSWLIKMVPFIIPVIGLMVFKKSFVPAAVGQNFKKDQR